MAKPIEIDVRIIGDATARLNNINKEMSNVAVTAQGKLSPALQVSKRDLGILTTQMISSTGIAGKMTGQLSNLATGLLMGGAIGGAFAGFAAIINGITERAKEHNTAMEAFENTSLEAAEKLKLINNELKEMADPGFWERINRGLLVIAGQWQSTAEDIIISMAQLESARSKILGGMLMSPDRGYVSSRQSELSTLKYQQSQAETLKEAQGYNQRILQLQKEIDAALGKQEKKTEKIKTDYELMIERLDVLRNKLLEQSVTARAQETRYGGLGDRASRETVGMVGVPNKPVINLGDFEQIQNEMQQFAQSSAGIFAMNMSQAWESIFGEANSMFEQLLVQWQSMLFEKIGFGIFNMLFGGIDLFGFARNLTSGQATAARYGMGK